MTTSEHVGHDFAESGIEQGERHAMELADRIRMVAAEDPELAQDLVDQLIVALDRATGGTFREHLDGAARGVAERSQVSGRNPSGAGVLLPRNS